VARKPIPSLKGWAWDLAEKADLLLAYYLTTDYSQSYLYKNGIYSLQYQIAIDGNRPSILESNVKNTLIQLFNKYFDKVEVEVSVNAPDPAQPNRLDLKLEIFVYEDNVMYSAGKEIETLNGKMNKVIDLLSK